LAGCAIGNRCSSLPGIYLGLCILCSPQLLNRCSLVHLCAHFGPK
jgi:hypothetical protein